MAVLKLINNSGLKEEKNLCFVNTSLQLLYSIPEIRDSFNDKAYKTDLTARLPISDEISRIFKTKGRCKTSAAELRRLTGQYHRRVDICNGSQQDMLEFTTLLLESLEQEHQSLNENNSKFVNKFTGRELNMKFFISTRDGACPNGHQFRSEPEIFKTIKLSVPDTDSELSLNHMIHNYYSVKSESIMMKCSDCCQHQRNCPRTRMCRLREAAEKKCLLSAPTFLYIQLLRFADIHSKIKTKVIPENVLVLPNENKYKLVSIGNHLGSLPTNGHYQALVKSGPTSWLVANDDNNYKTNIRGQINADNYILLYKKFSTKSLFVPSETWEEVLVDQPVPAGLHIQIDMQTGKKFAKYQDCDKKHPNTKKTNSGIKDQENIHTQDQVQAHVQKHLESNQFETQKCVMHKDMYKSTSTQHKPELGYCQSPFIGTPKGRK